MIDPRPTRRHFLRGAPSALLLASVPFGLAMGVEPAHAASDQEDLVDRARLTLSDLAKDQSFGNAKTLLAKARGVMIAPSLVKGGFIFGGEGGQAVILTKGGDGQWGYPAFYTIASVSVGFQIGLQEAEVIALIMSDKALSAFLEDEFKVGAQAGLSIVTLGSNAEAAVTSTVAADIIVWSSASGLYGGLALNGSIIKPRHRWNEAYYGRSVSVSDVLLKGKARNNNADRLRQSLATFR